MPTSPAFPHLQNQQYINLTTYRKTGVGVTTTVWFAQEGDKLYVYTQGNTGKIKRIRNNGKVEIGPCTRLGKPLGPTQPAVARIIAGEAGKHADELLKQKYGLLKRLISWIATLRNAKPSYVEITAA